MFTRTLALVAVAASPAAAQLRIVSYNTANATPVTPQEPSGPNPRPGMGTIFGALAADSAAGIARRPDVLVIVESSGAASTGEAFRTLLNSTYGVSSYQRGSLSGGSTGNGTTSVVYNSATVQLVSEAVVGQLASNGNPTAAAPFARQPLRYQLRPAGAGYTAAADFYLYGGHFKASDTSADADQRRLEALALRADADARPTAPGDGVRAVFAGDLNFYRPSEPGYTNLLAAGAARAADPVFPVAGVSPSTWEVNGAGASNNVPAIRALHSQSPATASAFPAQVLGGMNDRFDYQLPTLAVNSGRGLSQIAGTYRVFGNNGSHALNGAITTGTAQTAAVRQALAEVSDHLPVVADYRLPARLTAAVTAPPARVIRGQTAPVGLQVTNSAPVAVAAGADGLDYAFAGTGAVTQGAGSAAGLAALAPANAHVLGVPTTAAGSYSGAVTASPTSPQAASTFAPVSVTVTALDPARGSFADMTEVRAIGIDFGSVPAGQSDTRMAAVFNLSSAAGAALTANLRFRSITEATPGGPITATLAPTSSDLAAGGGNWTLMVQFGGSAPGSYSDTLTLNLSDEDILGATDQFLTINVSAFVPVPEPGTVAFLLAAAGGVGYARRRRG